MDTNEITCQSSAQTAEQESLLSSHAKTAIQTHVNNLDQDLKMKKEKDSPELQLLKRTSKSLSSSQLFVLQELMDSGGDLVGLIKNGVIKRPILNKWIVEDELFRSYWDGIVHGTLKTFKMEATYQLGKAIENIGEKLNEGTKSVYEDVAAGKFMQDIISADKKDNEAQAEEQITTTYDNEGRVLSVTEQRKITHQIRERRKLNNNEDE